MATATCPCRVSSSLLLVVTASEVSASRLVASSNSIENKYGTQAYLGGQDNLVWPMAHLGSMTLTMATSSVLPNPGPSFLDLGIWGDK